MSNNLNEQIEKYNPDIELRGNGNFDCGHNLADAILKQKKIKDLEKRVELEDYLSFVNAVKKSGVDINNEFKDRYEKEKLIIKYTTYKKLNGSENSLSECSNHKIGLAFKSIYSSALNKIRGYGGEELK